MDTPRNAFGFPGTDERVPFHTTVSSNARIREHTLRNLRPFVGAGKEEIAARIAKLRREWDIERTLELNAAAIALTGLAMGLAVDKRFLLIPAAVGGFLMYHAVQGWCPPLPAIRRMGVRTSAEIHAEILALRILRDDFNGSDHSAESALSMALG